jgi:LysR family hca operon transcriptional activator
MPELRYRTVTTEPLVVVLRSDHRLAANDALSPQDLAAETFIGMSNTAPTLRVVIDDYLKRSGIELAPSYEVDNISMLISLVASTRGVALAPLYVRNLLPWSVTARPIKGRRPDD